MDGKSRICYVLTKGDESIEAYLFTDELNNWLRKGYSYVLSRVQVH